MIGSRHVCQCCGRSVTITGTYDGSPDPDDSPGYYYTFDGEPGVRWITAQGANLRFRREGYDDATYYRGPRVPA